MIKLNEDELYFLDEMEHATWLMKKLKYKYNAKKEYLYKIAEINLDLEEVAEFLDDEIKTAQIRADKFKDEKPIMKKVIIPFEKQLERLSNVLWNDEIIEPNTRYLLTKVKTIIESRINEKELESAENNAYASNSRLKNDMINLPESEKEKTTGDSPLNFSGIWTGIISDLRDYAKAGLAAKQAEKGSIKKAYEEGMTKDIDKDNKDVIEKLKNMFKGLKEDTKGIIPDDEEKED